jgi:NAD(P)H-quinone oxidoreductase subunit 2
VSVARNHLPPKITLIFIMNDTNYLFPNLLYLLGNLSILPERILIINLILVVVIDLLNRGKNQILLHRISLISMSTSAAASPCQWGVSTASGSLHISTFGNIFRFLLLICSLLSVLLSVDYMRSSKTALAEFSLFTLTAGLGGMVLRCANDLVTIYVASEFLSLSSCFLSGYTKRDIRSNEATTKFLSMGGASSSSPSYGFSSLYGLSGGQLQLDKTADEFAFSQCVVAIYTSAAFITAGTAFKPPLVPFHQWTPDVYEGV